MPHRNPQKGVTVQDAAIILGTGRTTLFKLLRKNKFFIGTYPRYQHIKAGLFHIEQRSFTFERSGAERTYHVALITPTGMALLNELVNNNGNVVTLNAPLRAARVQ